MTNSTYTEQILTQRQEREKRLLAAPRNWFSLAGLFWLEAGENTFGSDPANAIVLPAAPAAHCGSLILRGEEAILQPALAGIKVSGHEPDDQPLHNDHDEMPDLIECGSLILLVIRRGEKMLLRVWDTAAKAVKEFHGLNYYPVNPDYCIWARFTPYDPPVVKKSSDIIGTELEIEFVGQVQFSLNGTECTLAAQDDEEGLLFHFSDLTKKDSTYPGGRFLLAQAPSNGEVILDFNLAVNWPCAYTSFATCPLTPFENALQVRIEAGEKRYHE